MNEQADCKHDPGVMLPVIDRNRCEAKEDCVRVCPFDVFEIRPLGSEEKRALSWKGWLKAWAHGHRQAFAVRSDACQGCARCIEACPEGPIRLARRD